MAAHLGVGQRYLPGKAAQGGMVAPVAWQLDVWRHTISAAALTCALLQSWHKLRPAVLHSIWAAFQIAQASRLTQPKFYFYFCEREILTTRSNDNNLKEMSLPSSSS